MTSDEQAFLAPIDANPTDEAQRLIFADWLDEHDRPEDAMRQRKWVAAYRHLMPYVRVGTWYYDDNGDRSDPAKDVDYKDMMSSINWWLSTASGKDRSFGLGGTIGFWSNWAQDELYDPEKRRLFWEAFEVITGFKAPQTLVDEESYHCAC